MDGITWMIQNSPLNISSTIFVHSDQLAPLLPLGQRISPAWKVKSYIAIPRHLILLTVPFYIHPSSLLHLIASLDKVENAFGFFGFNSSWPSLMDLDQDRLSKQPLVAYKGTVGLWPCSCRTITKHVDPYPWQISFFLLTKYDRTTSSIVKNSRCHTTKENCTWINILSASPDLPFSFSIIPYKWITTEQL